MFPRGGRRRYAASRSAAADSASARIILIGVVCLMLGINPLTLLTGGGLEIPNMPRPDRQGGPQDVPGLPGQGGVEDSNDEKATFVRRVLADTEDVWDQIFKGAGRQYREADAGAVHAAPRARRAAPASRRWGRSIVRPTRKCTSILRSTTT